MSIDYAEMMRRWEDRSPVKRKPMSPLSASLWPDTSGEVYISSQSQFIEAVPAPCETCGDTGFISVSEGSQRCGCKMRRHKVAANINALRCPLSHVQAMGVATGAVQGETSDRMDTAASEGVRVLTGGACSGKSFTAACIALRVCLTGMRALWVAADALPAMVREGYDKKRSMLATLQPYISTDLLVLDDVDGSENEHRCSTLSYVLKRRLEGCRPTVITTALDVRGLAMQFDSSVAARLRPGRAEWVHLTGVAA